VDLAPPGHCQTTRIDTPPHPTVCHLFTKHRMPFIFFNQRYRLLEALHAQHLSLFVYKKAPKLLLWDPLTLEVRILATAPGYKTHKSNADQQQPGRLWNRVKLTQAKLIGQASATRENATSTANSCDSGRCGRAKG
jgi:hypothetical protein